jgi:hypothetical protein
MPSLQSTRVPITQLKKRKKKKSCKVKVGGRRGKGKIIITIIGGVISASSVTLSKNHATWTNHTGCCSLPRIAMQK